MPYRSLTTAILDEVTGARSLRCAQALAQRWQAHLDVSCFGIDPTPYEGIAATGAFITSDQMSQALTTAERLRAWAESQTRGSDPSVAVEKLATSQLLLEQLLAKKTRYSDLFITTQPYAEDISPLMATVLEAVLFGANAPAMIFPTATETVPEFRRIVIGWNESEEALHAIRHALPIIAAADAVDIVMVDPPARSAEASDPGAALSLWLARHGTHCEVTVLARTLPRISDTIKRFAFDRDADLLVMGAYGHSRFRQALFGGATRDLLEEATCPILMAH